MDAVEKVGNGHPGTAMSLAPLAYLLYQRVMRHDPADPSWTGRDRFVLSAGHSSITQYVQLYLSGTGLELDDLKALRTFGSKTPGHPEYRHTAGVETTTGPLGQGLATAVGMAMAARRERGLLDPEAAPGESPFDHHDLRHRLRRRHPGGHHLRGVVAGRAPAAGQPRRRLRPEPDLHRGRHRTSRCPRTPRSGTSPTAGTSSPSTGARATTRATATSRTSSSCTRRSRRPGRTRAPPSSCCAPSSRGPPPTPATPGPRTARRSAPTRSGRPRSSWAWTPRRPSTSPRTSWPTPASVGERGAQAHAAWTERYQAWRAGEPGAGRSCSTGWPSAACPTAGPTPCRPSRPARRSPPAPPPATSCPRWPARCPSCGAAPPTSPAATTRR